MLNVKAIDPKSGCYRAMCTNDAHTLAKVNNTAMIPGDDPYFFEPVLCKQHFLEFIDADHLEIVKHRRVQA